MQPRVGTTSRSPRHRDPAAFVAYGAVLVAVVMTLFATRRGPGIGVDSTVYLSSGLNLATRHGLRVFDGGVLTLFPPGLPVVVAVGHRLGMSAEWTVRLFNTAACGAAVYLSYVLLRRHVRSSVLVAVATVLLAVSPALLGVSLMALTEVGFIVICLGLLLVLEHLVETPRSIPWVVAAVALVWAGFAFRYAGLALVPTVGVALLVSRREDPIRERAISAAIVTALAALGPAAWLIRNRRVDGTWMGFRNPSTDTVGSTATAFVDTLGSWVLPGLSSPTLHQIAGGLLALLGITALVWWARRGLRLGSLGPLVVFVVVYSGYLCAAQLTTAIDALNTRLMSALYVPLLVLGTVGVERVVRRAPVDRRRLVWGCGTLIVTVFLVGQVVVSVRDARHSARDGVFYSARSWQASELAEAARAVPVDAALYSNDPWGLWAILRRNGIGYAPFKGGFRSDVTFPVPDWFLMGVRCGPSYLASFEPGQGYFYRAAELRRFVDLDPVATAADGTLYRLRPSASDTEPCAWR